MLHTSTRILESDRLNDINMAVRVVSGANEQHLPIAGRSVRDVAHALRDAMNIGDTAEAWVNGQVVPPDYALADGDTLEFVVPFRCKGGLHEFWSEEEIVELFGTDALDEFREMRIEPVKEPVYTLQQIAAWQSSRRSSATSDEPSTKLIVDFSTMTLRYGDQGPFEIDSTLKYRIFARLARRPGFYVAFDNLKRDVWEDEYTEDETVSREIRRLRQALDDLGLRGVTIDSQRHRAAVKLD